MRRFSASVLIVLFLLAYHAAREEINASAQHVECTSWKTQYSELVSPSNNDKVITARHRGSFDESLPENSLSAFLKSFAECRPAIETDVRLTQDGVPVLFHDIRLGRVLEPDYDQETNKGAQISFCPTPLCQS